MHTQNIEQVHKNVRKHLEADNEKCSREFELAPLELGETEVFLKEVTPTVVVSDTYKYTVREVQDAAGACPSDAIRLTDKEAFKNELERVVRQSSELRNQLFTRLISGEVVNDESFNPVDNQTFGYEYTCKSCKGEGQLQCVACNGEGRVNCRTCNGRREVICQRCKGTNGIVMGCARCGSTGFIDHPPGQRNTCYACGGMQGHYCPDCNGSQRVQCKECLATGHTTCSSCVRGLITCEGCEGSGRMNHTAKVFLDVTRTSKFSPNAAELEHHRSTLEALRKTQLQSKGFVLEQIKTITDDTVEFKYSHHKLVITTALTKVGSEITHAWIEVTAKASSLFSAVVNPSLREHYREKLLKQVRLAMNVESMTAEQIRAFMSTVGFHELSPKEKRQFEGRAERLETINCTKKELFVAKNRQDAESLILRPQLKDSISRSMIEDGAREELDEILAPVILSLDHQLLHRPFLTLTKKTTLEWIIFGAVLTMIMSSTLAIFGGLLTSVLLHRKLKNNWRKFSYQYSEKVNFQIPNDTKRFGRNLDLHVGHIKWYALSPFVVSVALVSGTALSTNNQEVRTAMAPARYVHENIGGPIRKFLTNRLTELRVFMSFQQTDPDIWKDRMLDFGSHDYSGSNTYVSERLDVIYALKMVKTYWNLKNARNKESLTTRTHAQHEWMYIRDKWINKRTLSNPWLIADCYYEFSSKSKTAPCTKSAELFSSMNAADKKLVLPILILEGHFNGIHPNQ